MVRSDVEIVQLKYRLRTSWLYCINNSTVCQNLYVSENKITIC